MSMTTHEARARLHAFERMIGSGCDSYLNINRYPDGKNLHLNVYADGITGGMTFSAEGDTFEEVFDAAAAKWEEVKERTAAGKIERMALEIIRVTAIKGQCQGCDLRTAKFSQADIDRYGALACAKADAMANNGPFSIAPEAKANAA